MEFFFSNGLAESTQREYSLAKRRYVHFCVHHNNNVPGSNLKRAVMPVCAVFSFTIFFPHNSYLATVRHLHIAERADNPEIAKMPCLEQVLRGINNKKGKVRLPIFDWHSGEDKQSETSQDTGVELQPRQRSMDLQMPPSRCWDTGRAMHTKSTSRPQEINLPKYLRFLQQMGREKYVWEGGQLRSPLQAWALRRR